MDDISIPVTIDDVKRIPDFRFARCEYFTIECVTPTPGWTLELGSLDIPILMLGLSGVVYRPSPTKARFKSGDQIEGLFDAIEMDGELSVGTADIWLPNGLLERAVEPKKKLGRGLTVRIGLPLFKAALLFRTDSVDRSGFAEAAEGLARSVRFSKKENKAFAQWRQMQVKRAKDDYPKDREMELHWNDRSNGPGEQKGDFDE